MKRKLLLLTICVVGVYNISMAQTANETLGTNAGQNLTTGDNNVLVGDFAGENITSSSQNTFVGTETGKNQTVASNIYGNTFMGFQAGYNNINNTDYTFIGFRAGYYADFGSASSSDLTFVGAGAGFNMIDGDDNVFIGDNAGVRYTTGDDNTFVGSGAGGSSNSSVRNTTTTTSSPATGSDNTAVGSVSGKSLTTGHRNAFFGNDSGTDTTTGYKNTFVGDSTGIDNSVGRLNTFVGQAAGSANEYSNYNTFIGAQAGGDNNRLFNQTGSNRNTYVGVFAGYRNRNGEDNVGMGAFADYEQGKDILNITGVSSILSAITINRYRTTFIGAQAFPNNDDVIAIGYKARVDGAYGIAIGSNSRAQSTNSMAIGNTVDVTKTNTMALGGDLTTNRVSVGIGTVAANTNASLDLADTDKGLLINRVTNAERTTMVTTPASGVALTTTDAGLLVYDTDDNLFYFWNGTEWSELGKTTVGSGVSAVPELLNYQSSVRDAAGDILENQLVSFRMNVIDVTSSNTTVYSETHDVTTSSQGIVNFKIGNGTIVSGVFTDIDWSHNNALEIELDVAGGTTYVTMGTTSFVSVPYALRAKYAENLTSSTHAKTAIDKEDRIQDLENEVKELKEMVNKLLKGKE